MAHSLSPLVHNAGYRALGLDFVYLAWRVTDLAAAVNGMRGMGMRGLSVTLPHKVAAVDLVDAVDEAVTATGALNTIVNDGDKLTGHSTDGEAARRALLEKTEVAGKEAVIIGAGGSALCIAHALKEAGARLTVLNRNAARAAALAQRVGAAAHGDLSRLEQLGAADIIVNATSAGMWPAVDTMPLPDPPFRAGQTIFDAVYNPLQTKFLARARAAGAQTVPGHRMFLFQAAAQFQLFTGQEAPLEEMQRVLLEALKGDANA